MAEEKSGLKPTSFDRLAALEADLSDLREILIGYDLQFKGSKPRKKMNGHDLGACYRAGSEWFRAGRALSWSHGTTLACTIYWQLWEERNG